MGWKKQRIRHGGYISVREKLAALKLIIEANEARVKLLSEGPSVLAIGWLEARMNKLEIEVKREVNRKTNRKIVCGTSSSICCYQ